ncbi:MAG: hypothetical protein R3E08_04365 [Thiotrichaceae bacterium]
MSEFEAGNIYQKRLSIPEAYEIEVQVTGDTSIGRDKLFLYDENNQPVVPPLSGQIDWHGTVASSLLQIQFKSSKRSLAIGHFTVKIAKKDSNQVYQEIQQKLSQAANKILEINVTDIKSALEQHINEVTALHDKINKTQEIKELVREVVSSLMNLAKIYQNLTAMHPTVTRTHQQQLEEIRLLKQRIKGYQSKARDNGKRTDLATESENATKLSAMYVTEQDLWEKLFIQATDLETKLNEFSQKISILLDLLVRRAKIYQKTADLALMSETTWGGLRQLIPATDVQKLCEEIGEIEQNISELLSKL